MIRNPISPTHPLRYTSPNLQQLPIVRPRKLLPPRHYPKHQAKKHHQPRGRTRVIHVLACHRFDRGQVGNDTYEGEIQEADDVDDDTPAAERVRAFEARLFARKVREDAGSEGHEVGEICNLCK